MMKFDFKYICLNYILPLLFVAKLSFFAFYFTPLWDVPDETGHVSYALEIFENGSFPVFGESRMHENVIASQRVYESSYKGTTRNWIAVHPPLYYLTLYPFAYVGNLLLPDNSLNSFELKVKILRSANIFYSLIALFFLVLLLNNFFSRTTSYAFATILASIPMYTHLSSGATNDIFIFMNTVIFIYFLFIYHSSKRITHWFLSIIFFAFALLSKAFAIFLTPLILPYLLYFFKTRKLVFLFSIILLVLGYSWHIMNFFLYGSILPNLNEVKIVTNISFGEFFFTKPYFIETFKNFYAWIGWLGRGVSSENLKFIQANKFPLFYFTFFSFYILALCIYCELRLINNKILVKYIYIFLITLYVILFSLFVDGNNLSINSISYFISMIFPLFIILFISQFFNSTFKLNNLGNILNIKTFIYLLMILIFFIFIVKFYYVFLQNGYPRAVHGRYFLFILPLISLYVGILFNRFNINPFVNIFLTIMIPLVFVINEFYFYYSKIFPFYYS